MAREGPVILEPPKDHPLRTLGDTTVVTFDDDGNCLSGSIQGSPGSTYFIYTHPKLPGIRAADVNKDGRITCSTDRVRSLDLFVADHVRNISLDQICNYRTGWQPRGDTITEMELAILLSCRAAQYQDPPLSSQIVQLWPFVPLFLGALSTVGGLALKTYVDKRIYRPDPLSEDSLQGIKRLQRYRKISWTMIGLGIIGVVIGAVALHSLIREAEKGKAS